MLLVKLHRSFRNNLITIQHKYPHVKLGIHTRASREVKG